MNKLFFALLLTVLSLPLYAQQEQHYTQFMYNKLLINPAYAGQREVESVTAIYRNQWVGFDGAPKSALVSFSAPFFSQRVGFGLNLSHVTIGLQRDFHASLAYSYALVSNENMSIRLGVMGTVRSLGLQFNDANPLTPAALDPSIDDRRVNEVYGNAGAGLYANFGEYVYAGFSVPRLISNNIGLNLDPDIEAAKERQHFYGMVGGMYPINENLRLTSALLLKYVKNAPFDADLNVNLEINKVSTGLSYRFGGDGAGESMDLLLFYQISPQIGVGGAYDITLSNIRNYSSGSFELLLLADLRKPKNRRMANPRFFM